MPIKSFIAYPSLGGKKQLEEELSNFRNCEVTPSTNQDILIVVTDIPDKKAEEMLLQSIRDLEHCDQLSMVAGFNDNETLINE